VLEDAELIEFTDAEDYRRKAEHLASRQLENPVTGERIVFLRTGEETGGEFLEMEDFWARPDHRTPEHIHPEMEERWEVLAGSVGFRIDGAEQIAGPGDVIVASPGSSHTAWNAGEETVRLRIQMRPALRWQEFVERLFALANDGYIDERGLSNPHAVSALIADFPREIAPPA
jgi:quercetin dioxygenase-like cupin family protein